MRSIPSIIALGVILLATSCTRDPAPSSRVADPARADPPAVPPAVISPAVQQAVREKGRTIVAQAFGILSSRLGKAIADAGFTNAIEVCAVHGLTLISSVGVSNQVVLRRVTHRPRNPQNRADATELAIIRQFETELSKGATPEPIVTANKPDSFTYYAPIVLNLPLCLSCHGEPGTDIKADVQAQIKEKYPTDEAIGFKQGQLRGLWSVDFKRADFVTAVEH